MANAKIILECPNCNHTQEAEYRYDYNSTEQIKCESCGFTVAKWCWNYICNVKDLPDKDKEYNAPLENPNGICNTNILIERW